MKRVNRRPPDPGELRLILLLSIALASLATLDPARASRGAISIGGTDLVFADGFESGDLSAWDRTQGGPPGASLPPDPAEVVLPYDPTVAIDIYGANEIIWTGVDPIQRDVEPGAIKPRRLCLLRGRVLERDGAPLRAVRVTVHDAPQLGWTWTRPDGAFDLAVNGGGEVGLRFEKEGYLPIFRTLRAPEQDWSWVEDAVMIRLDPEFTEITAEAGEMQVARGSVESDADGSRQATVLVPAGTAAEMVLPDGKRVQLGAFKMRATEYTVGDAGPAAMPAPLPENTGYTYAVELSVDEATAAGATTVEFSSPLPVHLENFLGFPVGEPVPAGFFDRVRGVWVPSPNGRIVKILSVTGGLVDLDVDGSGQPADPPTLESLAISDDERQRLAVLYPIGQELWRVRVPHFSPWDFNWPYGPPDDWEAPPDPEDVPPPGEDPPDPGPDPDLEDGQPEVEDPCLLAGSILECENQVLRESISLVGVPYSLWYSSDRAKGRSNRRHFRLRLTDDSVPQSLVGIDVAISVAGRLHEQTFAPVADLVHTFDWDQIDRFNRPLHAEDLATIRITYHFAMRYFSVRDEWEASLSRFPGGVGAVMPSVRSTSPTIAVTRELFTTAGALAGSATGSWDIAGERLGGWSFDVHHRYSPRTRTLLLGTGGRRYAQDLGVVAPRTAGTGEAGNTGDGGPARLAQLDAPESLAWGPDGSLYVVDRGSHKVRRVAPDGTISTFAGNGFICDARGCGDGGPATEATFFGPTGVAISGDGSLLISDSDCVRRVDETGTILGVADECNEDGGSLQNPTSLLGDDCDDCPALEADLFGVEGIAAAADGGYYVAESQAHRVRFVGADGIITTLAGTGVAGFSGDGGPAGDAQLDSPTAVAIGPDGVILIADTGNHRIRQVDRDGRIRTLAGVGTPGAGGDGGPAADAQLSSPRDLVAAADGSFLVADRDNGRVRRVLAGGTILTVAGGGSDSATPAGSYALQIAFGAPSGIALRRDGSFVLADRDGNAVFEVSDARPVAPEGELWIPSEDGSQLFVFDPQGRHLRTRHALTGATLLEFGYSAAGLL